MITPIVIRRKSCLTDKALNVETSSFVIDSEDEMVQDVDEDDGGPDHLGAGAERSNQQEGLGIPAPPMLTAAPGQTGEKSVFHTFRPEGGLRDVLTIECQKLN